MKVLAVLVAVCTVISLSQAELNLTEEQKVKLEAHHKACSGQDSYLGNLLEGALPDEKPFKDYLLCISKRIGFQNEAGEVQKDIILSKLKQSISDPGKAEEYLDKCLVTGEPADVVFKVVSCLQETTPNVLVA